MTTASGCIVIEVVDSRAFMAACLLFRWARATGENPEGWDGYMRSKWIAASFKQKQYDFEEVNPYAE